MTIYVFPRAPWRLLVHLGSRAGSPGSPNQNFQKMNKVSSGIHPNYKCAKFQTEFTIYGFPRVLQNLEDTHTWHCQVLAQLNLRSTWRNKWNKKIFWWILCTLTKDAIFAFTNAGVEILRLERSVFLNKFEKDFFIIFSFLSKRSFQGIFSCLEILNASA